MTTHIAAGPVDRKVRAQIRNFEVRYITYNNFRTSVFTTSEERAKQLLSGLLELKHVYSAEIVERPNVK